ncbi:hypothetical protein BDW72DRAFT_197687 [Aspergillus terricola var. indicus]
MSMLSLLVVYAFTAPVPVSAQSCNSITITSQASADSAFNSCSSISGSVTIAPSASGTLALDGLKRISEDLIIESTNLVGISIPDIEDVGGSVTVTGNEQLNRLSLGSLSNIGGDLEVQGNNALVDLVMDNLEVVRGGVHLAGGFNRLSFEELERVGRDSEIVATGSAGCAGIDALNQAGSEEAEGEVFRGSYTCATTSASPTSTSTSTATTSTPTSTSSGTSTDSSADPGLGSGAIAGIVVGVVVGVLMILVLIWLFLCKRRKNRVFQDVDTAAIGGGFSSGSAAAVVAKSKDEEKGPNHSTSPSTSPTEGSAPVLAAAGGGGGGGGGGGRGSIPRRPVSTATTSISSPSTYRPSSTFPSSLAAGTSNPSSMPLPTALIPGTNGASDPAGGRRSEGEGDALFFTTTPSAARPRPRPAREPSESDVPMLDSEIVHEVSGVAVPARGEKRSERVVGGGTVFELDGGFDGARHQRAINGEPEGDARQYQE